MSGEGESEPPPGVPGEEWAVRQFRGLNLRIGRNRTVHRVAFLLDERGIEVPAPDCHTGYFAVGRPWWKVYAPTAEHVDCGLCLERHRGRGRELDAGPHQLELNLDGPSSLG
ncbi:MAG TPA: hypothetical protein VHX38_41430 [Pseudonocardiaceae bacterium]|nr:hypothetical protein [Pseudonocardiaceae bacterium]